MLWYGLIRIFLFFIIILLVVEVLTRRFRRIPLIVSRLATFVIFSLFVTYFYLNIVIEINSPNLKGGFIHLIKSEGFFESIAVLASLLALFQVLLDNNRKIKLSLENNQRERTEVENLRLKNKILEDKILELEAENEQLRKNANTETTISSLIQLISIVRGKLK